MGVYVEKVGWRAGCTHVLCERVGSWQQFSALGGDVGSEGGRGRGRGCDCLTGDPRRVKGLGKQLEALVCSNLS